METEAQGMRIPDLMPERGFPGSGADQLTQVVLNELAESGLRLFGVRGPSPLSQDLVHEKYN